MMRLKQNCSDSCDCQTAVIATYTTNHDNPVWRRIRERESASRTLTGGFGNEAAMSNTIAVKSTPTERLSGYRANLKAIIITTALWSFNRVVPILVARSILVGTKSLGRLKGILCLTSIRKYSAICHSWLMGNRQTLKRSNFVACRLARSGSFTTLTAKLGSV